MPFTTCQSFTTPAVEETDQSIGLPAFESRRKGARTVFPSDSNWIVVVYHFNTKTWWNDQGAMSFGVEAYGAWIQQPTFIDSDAMAGLS